MKNNKFTAEDRGKVEGIITALKFLGQEHLTSYQEEIDWLNGLEARIKTTLPSNVDEAANAYVGHPIEIDEDSSCYTTREAFKAGAEWMAKQGQSFENRVLYSEEFGDDISIDSLVPIQLDKEKFNVLDKVIVQM